VLRGFYGIQGIFIVWRTERAFYQKILQGSTKVAKPLIWLRDKGTKDEVLICAFSTVGESCVYLSGEWIQVFKLIERYEFLDGTPCGMPIGNPNKTDDKKVTDFISED
jgi:hypothetical protein